MSIESHLDNVFNEYAHQIQNDMQKNGPYNYKLWSNSGSLAPDKLIKTGRCEILQVRYAKHIDCNIYTIRDLDTGEKINANQFRINFNKA